MFSQADLQQIRDRGLSLDDINRQIRHFKEGFPPARLSAPAVAGRGILVLTEGEEQYYKDVFLNNAPDFRIIRFIPASGAATRMFKSLYAALEALSGLKKAQQKAWVEENREIRKFLKKIEKYPFYEDLGLKGKEKPSVILEAILGEEGLNYGKLPKGLLKFHRYDDTDRRTALEEHIREAIKYCVSRSRLVRIHLTVSPDHLEGFKAEAREVCKRLEEETGMQVEVNFSFQLPETDTIAVDPSNEPFRNPDGSLLFRPGGHGALIRNLDALDGDLVFISNIDNVSPDRNKNLRVRYKQVLGGLLLEIRSKVHYYLQQLTSEDKPEKTRMDHMLAFLHEKLGLAIPEKLESWEAPELRDWLIETLDRPIRVCGMVRNEGEPGGGPFYVQNKSGQVSLQIVESSQIDHGNMEQETLFKESTHFNPVDLVCSMRDFRGEAFNLQRYVDHNTGFISEKSLGGRDLKALELPGLWNGAMAHWLTLFVEVPAATFSPVKTVFDLHRKEHRS